MNLFAKTETDTQTQRTIDIYTLLCIRQITNENLQGKSKRRYKLFIG